MEKNSKATAAKDEALKESFAEIKKAAATVKETAKKPAAKTETAKAAEKKEAAKKPEAKKTETKAETKVTAKKPAEKKPAAAEKAEVSTYITLQINGRDYEPSKLQADAIAAAKAIKADVQSVDVYVNVAESAAYYTIDGVGSSDYRIDL
ncbi:MAG: hypothetical protein J5943_05560 [Oribacterium sp.]|nr:hypothetical protein [Oribacterium sp.]MBO6309450.1 hypothetical protein [Oribacterium sp.]MBP3806147.1 hypothetical protein [Oribacterium sp.]